MAENVVEFKRPVHPLLDDGRDIVIVHGCLDEGDVEEIHAFAEGLRAQGHSPEQIAALCATELREWGFDEISAVRFNVRDPDHDGMHALHIDDEDDD